MKKTVTAFERIFNFLVNWFVILTVPIWSWAFVWYMILADWRSGATRAIFSGRSSVFE